MSESANQNTINAEYIKAYDTLLSCRKIDIELFATRFNLFLVLEGAVLLVASNLLIKVPLGAPWVDKMLPGILIVLGLLISSVGARLMRLASFWVGYWEHRLNLIEDKVYSSLKIFSDHPSKQNKQALAQFPKHLRYGSTRNAMLWLAYLLIVLWLFIAVLIVLR